MLVKYKKKLEQLCEDPSDYAVMINDLAKGNELGLSCFSGFISVDFSLIGAVCILFVTSDPNSIQANIIQEVHTLSKLFQIILNSVTFAIIVIQAQLE